MEKISFDDVEKMINNFRSLHKTMHYMMMEKTEKFNISPDQTRLLFILQNHQNINQNALAKKLNITKATLSVRLQRLEKLGYLTKTQDKNDKRNYILNITETGEIFIETAIRIMKEKTLIMFEGVSKEQITIINDVIDIMKNNIKKCKGEE
ncbi:MarR family winged helix-turn-helix transcriptional regulator [Thomasclavelia cocleata]|uniref:MarR family winged helix-turn-helix transcriptional regulator n=1 Tax=Thomasclavelia cocleata TaxID=69824 RepID=UPI00242A66BC|nr:MarR family transcriptional regulator [Thomasclavelia cocleata]